MLLPVLLILAAAAEPPLRSVEIELTQTNPYCGGAAPSPEILEQAAMARPLSGSTYLIRRGAQNNDTDPLHELVLDAAGRATVELEPGPYCLVTPAKREAVLPVPKRAATREPNERYEDPVCLAQQQLICDLTFEVSAGEGTQTVAQTFHSPCFWRPGACYRGPPISPPPSAAPRR
jgi:hypothetical protein